MRISDWSSDVCSSDLYADKRRAGKIGWVDEDGKRRGYRKADDGTLRRELGGILLPAISHAVKSKRLKEADVPPIALPPAPEARDRRSAGNTSELQSLMRISYAVLCFKQQKHQQLTLETTQPIQYSQSI